MSHPRGLSAEEAALWDKLAATVKPLHPLRKARAATAVAPVKLPPAPLKPVVPAPAAQPAPSPAKAPVMPPLIRPDSGLDSHWERRFKGGVIEPDFTLDLHGHTLDSAHARLDDGLAQAKAMGARVILLIAGKPRPVEAADRGQRRGAIRAKLLDWLAAGPHGSDIAAIRKAHRRHGGEGALYLVLKRRR
jgi:DNA-nicking Smr family endonuclease